MSNVSPLDPTGKRQAWESEYPIIETIIPAPPERRVCCPIRGEYLSEDAVVAMALVRYVNPDRPHYMRRQRILPVVSGEFVDFEIVEDLDAVVIGPDEVATVEGGELVIRCVQGDE